MFLQDSGKKTKTVDWMWKKANALADYSKKGLGLEKKQYSLFH